MLTRPPSRPAKPATRQSRKSLGLRIRLVLSRRRWLRRTLWVIGGLFVAMSIGLGFLWVHDARLIRARLGGIQRPIPRIFGRPFELHAGQGLSPAQLIQRLNDVGYAERAKVAQPGEFQTAPTAVIMMTRPLGGAPAQTIRADFAKPPSAIVTKLSIPGTKTVLDSVTLESPMLAAIAPGEKRRFIPIDKIPAQVVNAVIAIEDRRFFDHPGVDPIGAIGAIITNLRGNRPYLVGGSTLTQQIIKNTFLTPQKTLRRKLHEQFMALVLESQFTKMQILELYLNDVVLGQRGPFEIHGVGEAARIFFGKDVTNLSLAEAATIAGLIQSPSRLSPFRNPERAIERRNVVLREMADGKYVTREAAEKASKEPLTVQTRALENEAPYFVDYVSQLVDEQYANLLKSDAAVDVYTTLDLRLQRLAQEAVADGIAKVDKQLAGRKKVGQPEVALMAVDPRTGEILAFVGGRAYNVSQYDRVVAAKRQPGSVFKPFVYLAAFEKMAAEGKSDFTPATVVVDEPTTFKDGDKDYTPANYENKYAGPVTLRNALAHSRNIVAIKVAEGVGYGYVADFWSRLAVGSPAKPFPSMALGVFEASPIDMAEAYTIFANGGNLRPLQAVAKIVENGKPKALPVVGMRSVARADTTYLVTNMMRSVLDEGTGASARASFKLDAAGKSGTTNDLRDAWFVGFTPELLTIVWVGFDNNQPIGLSGSQAALPIWTTFMRTALAARPSVAFDVPAGVVFEDIDPETGQVATTNCPSSYRESFLAGTEPHETCHLHGGNPLGRLLKWLIRR